MKKTPVVIVHAGRAVAACNTSAKNGEVVAFGFERALGGALVQVGTGKISRAQKYMGDKELMYCLDAKPSALVNAGGGECY